jgi:hypothetical protein
MLKRKLDENEAVRSRENSVRKRPYAQEKLGEEEAVCSRELGEEEAVCTRGNWVRRRQYAQEETG